MSRSAISVAIATALAGARVNLQNPIEERVGFEPAQLDVVARLFREQSTREPTLDAARAALHEAVDALDLSRSVAALALVNRLEAQTGRTYREGRDGALEVVDDQPLAIEE